MKYYFDTSSLVKIYHAEAGTTEVLALYKNSACSLLISELSRIEFFATVYRKYREKRLSSKALQALIRKFKEDLNSRYEVLPFSSLVTIEAENLLQSFAEKHALKSLDSIQFSFFNVYCDINTVFVCSDSKLVSLVKSEGYRVLLP